MKQIFATLLFVGCFFCAQGQRICTKTLVIEPIFSTEDITIETPEQVEWVIADVGKPAVYQTVLKTILVKEGYFKITDRFNIATNCNEKCKVWVNPESRQISQRILVQAAMPPVWVKRIVVAASIEVIQRQTTQRQGDVRIVETDCGDN